MVSLHRFHSMQIVSSIPWKMGEALKININKYTMSWGLERVVYWSSYSPGRSWPVSAGTNYTVGKVFRNIGSSRCSCFLSSFVGGGSFRSLGIRGGGWFPYYADTCIGPHTDSIHSYRTCYMASAYIPGSPPIACFLAATSHGQKHTDYRIGIMSPVASTCTALSLLSKIKTAAMKEGEGWADWMSTSNTTVN